jgi:hypothetical protein
MNGSQFPVLSSQKKPHQTLLRWMKFNAVGGIGIGVQLAALAFFRSWLKLDYLLATGLAVEITVDPQLSCGMSVSPGLTGRQRGGWSRSSGLAKFNASNGAVSIVGNLLLMRLLVAELGCQLRRVESRGDRCFVRWRIFCWGSGLYLIRVRLKMRSIST